jgi:hypothetical protein
LLSVIKGDAKAVPPERGCFGQFQARRGHCYGTTRWVIILCLNFRGFIYSYIIYVVSKAADGFWETEYGLALQKKVSPELYNYKDAKTILAFDSTPE